MNIVYFATVDRLNLASVQNRLSPRRIEKIQRLQVDLDKLRSAGCELLLRRHLIHQNLEPNLEYNVQSGGKPQLKHHKNLFFNYSHCEAFSGCVVSDFEVGLDMERLRDYSKEKVEKLSKRVMSLSQENDILKDNLLVERFIEHWVVKESFSKLIGMGMSLPFRTIQIDWQTNQVWVDEHKKAYFHLERFENIYIGVTSFVYQAFQFEWVLDLE